VQHEGATKGIMIITSDYSSDCYKFAGGRPLNLIEGSGPLPSASNKTSQPAFSIIAKENTPPEPVIAILISLRSQQLYRLTAVSLLKLARTRSFAQRDQAEAVRRHEVFIDPDWHPQPSHQENRSSSLLGVHAFSCMLDRPIELPRAKIAGLWVH
jgi:hypothetical protein